MNINQIFYYLFIITVYACGFSPSSAAQKLHIKDVVLTKSNFHISDQTLEADVFFENTGEKRSIEFWHQLQSLNTPIEKPILRIISVNNIGLTKFTISRALPKEKGSYFLRTWLKEGSKEVDSFSTAFDVSSDWKLFPRYGFVSHYDFSDAKGSQRILAELSRFNINAVFLYDWHASHQNPSDSTIHHWRTLSSQYEITTNMIKDLISVAKKFGQKVFTYNLINGAYDKYRDYPTNSYFTYNEWYYSQPNQEWGIYFRDKYGRLTMDHHGSSDEWQSWGWMTNQLLLFNPCNPDWRQYIFDHMSATLADFDFDGWHMDTLGNRDFLGPLYNHKGESIPDIFQCYEEFINEAKLRILPEKNITYSFNAVGGESGGLSSIMKSNVDIVFLELWDSPETRTHYELQQFVKNIRKKTDKPVIIAGYINMNKRHVAKFFSHESVVLAYANVLASGAWLFGIGDMGRLACAPYLPDSSLTLKEETKQKIVEINNFGVAYQNLLRSQMTTYPDEKLIRVDIPGFNVCNVRNPNQNCLLLQTTKIKDKVIIQLINLLDQTDLLWRDPNMLATPIHQYKDIPIHINFQDKKVAIKSAWTASPEINHGIPEPTEIQNLTNKEISIRLKNLFIWSLLVIEMGNS